MDLQIHNIRLKRHYKVNKNDWEMSKDPDSNDQIIGFDAMMEFVDGF